MGAELPFKYLDWDSDFFQLNVGRITESRLDPASMAQALEWAGQRRIDCLYYLAELDDLDSIHLAEENGFHYIDTRVTLERRFEKSGPLPFDANSEVRLADLNDLPALRAIARTCYHETRFYADPNFPEAQVIALYETWIENSFKGFADAVLTMEVDHQPAGYVSCRLSGGGKGNIGLVGVKPGFQGKSLGRCLVESAVNWFAERDVESISVATQGRNFRALRLYQRCGFFTSMMQLWYHKWFK